MKKNIALILAGLATIACDPFQDAKGGAPAINAAMVSGAGIDPVEGTAANGAWTINGVTPSDTANDEGRVIIVVANQLLDGASIELEPSDPVTATGGCVPAGSTAGDPNGWLTVTAPAAHPADDIANDARWYTCYYPSSATATDGGSVYIYWAAAAPSASVFPFEISELVAGTYRFQGEIRVDEGGTLPIDVTVNVAP